MGQATCFGGDYELVLAIDAIMKCYPHDVIKDLRPF